MTFTFNTKQATLIRRSIVLSLPPLLVFPGCTAKVIEFNQQGNTKRGSIAVPLTSCLTGLESAAWQMTIFVFICKTDSFKPVKQEVNGTVILSPLVFPESTHSINGSLGGESSVTFSVGLADFRQTLQVDLFDVVRRKHAVLARPVYGAGHPALVDVDAVDDDVTVVEWHLRAGLLNFFRLFLKTRR